MGRGVSTAVWLDTHQCLHHTHPHTAAPAATQALTRVLQAL